ncbi:anthranilate synthase family protein [Actinomycetaceae bacterium MB13-C1-2]|nr:anthranilate synthase family protein [Actinomycetaceae bacterium MB13-C1-2]
MTQPAMLTDDLATVLSGRSSWPVAVIRRENEPEVDVYTGRLGSASLLREIPLEGDEVIAAVPYRQIRERGFDAIDDDAALQYLTVEKHWKIPLTTLIGVLPQDSPEVEDLGFSTDDEEYAKQVERVIEGEIGRGEGANFVIRRDYRARTDSPFRSASLSWLRRLLAGEQGAYWTFAFITPEMALVGASPERHVSAKGGTVLMNPISGTFRHGGTASTTEDLLAFLADRKESEELVMVVDEELKMMSAVCPTGGVMRGPFLKPMSRVTHTEYLLEGQSDLDVREILRLTMFAPTVTGSPMGNACTVIARHETSGRGYYSGVLAHFRPDGARYELDAPIMIRTAEVSANGDIKVGAGATLVRHSDPAGEVLETKVKASGVLTALGLLESKSLPPREHHKQLVEDPRVTVALAARNRDLAPFWRDEQTASQAPETAKLSGTALVIDCGDEFTTMLAHQLRHLGLNARILPWDQVEDNPGEDLVVFGPGPGDPSDRNDRRIVRVSELIASRIESALPMVAVCLSHQILSLMAGLPVEPLPVPRQGQPVQVTLFGEPSLIGFYNTFAARAADGTKTPELGLVAHSEPDSDIVHSLTGTGVASVQGHLESVLSLDGFPALRRVVDHAMMSGEARKQDGE